MGKKFLYNLTFDPNVSLKVTMEKYQLLIHCLDKILWIIRVFILKKSVSCTLAPYTCTYILFFMKQIWIISHVMYASVPNKLSNQTNVGMIIYLEFHKCTCLGGVSLLFVQ